MDTRALIEAWRLISAMQAADPVAFPLHQTVFLGGDVEGWLEGRETHERGDPTNGMPTSTTSTSTASTQPAQPRKRQAQEDEHSTGPGLPFGGWQRRTRSCTVRPVAKPQAQAGNEEAPPPAQVRRSSRSSSNPDQTRSGPGAHCKVTTTKEHREEGRNEGRETWTHRVTHAR